VFVRRRPDSPDPIFTQTGRPPAGQSTARLRVCKHHGLIEHHLCRQGKRAPRWRCKRCAGEAVTRRHQKVRSIVVAAAGGCCVVCGYSRLSSALQFHHVDPTLKVFDVNPSSGKALAAYLEEARKCVLVCANCHVEIEAGVTPCPPLTACWPEPP
jgi:hypothetical protein